MTEQSTRPRQMPAADRFDADAAALQARAARDHRMARRYRHSHSGSPRPVRHARERIAPTLPCQQHDPELWFADTPTDLEQAKTLCAACPLRLTCLAFAVASHEYAGVWGGQIFERGRIVPHKRPRGRPRLQHVTPGIGPLSQDKAVPTDQASVPRNTPEDRVDAAVRHLEDAESAVCAAHQSHVDASINAANNKLRDAATEYLAATAPQHQSSPDRVTCGAADAKCIA